MYFADFKNIKIVKEYNPHVREAEIVVTLENVGWLVLLKDLDKVIEQFTKDPEDYPTLYVLTIVAPFSPSKDWDVPWFVSSIANYLVPELLKKLETGKGYQREHRLGAPDALKPLHTTYSTIKRAVNHEMKNTCLNIQIKIEDCYYILCDGKELEKEEPKNE